MFLPDQSILGANNNWPCKMLENENVCAKSKGAFSSCFFLGLATVAPSFVFDN